jgi:hypothetical protein
MKKIITAVLLIVLASCNSNKEREPQNAVTSVPEPGAFIKTEDQSRAFLKSKTFYGKTYRIEMDAKGKLKVFNNSDGEIFFESTPGHKFEIGELKNDGRWVSIDGGEWMIQPINGQKGQLDTKFEFVLLKDQTLMITKTGDVYSLVEETVEPNDAAEK